MWISKQPSEGSWLSVSVDLGCSWNGNLQWKLLSHCWSSKMRLIPDRGFYKYPMLRSPHLFTHCGKEPEALHSTLLRGKADREYVIADLCFCSCCMGVKLGGWKCQNQWPKSQWYNLFNKTVLRQGNQCKMHSKFPGQLDHLPLFCTVSSAKDCGMFCSYVTLPQWVMWLGQHEVNKERESWRFIISSLATPTQLRLRLNWSISIKF